jgi:hypothetical protein
MRNEPLFPPDPLPKAATPVHRDAWPTEIDAAARMAKSADTLKARVYRALRVAGRAGLTGKEIHRQFGGHDKLPEYSVRPRLTDLKDNGLIAPNGERRERNMVWALVEYIEPSDE